jgi:hypothetical protein
MRRATLLTIVLLLLGVLAVAVIAETPIEPGLPAGCQASLDEYLAAYASPGITRLLRVEQARTPWRFDRNMSSTVFGDSLHYQTDTSSSGMPLPFPPEQVWCALLERANGTFGLDADMPYAVVFVGLHMDLYNADWVVHEGAGDPSSPQLRETLSAIGCDLGLN